MSRHCTTIEAESEIQAMEKACASFNAPTNYILLTPKASGVYEACLQHRDASIEVAISDDGMFATVASYIPPFGDGKPLNTGAVVKCLTRAGVRLPPPPNAIQHCIDEVAKGRDISGLLLVKGRDPEDARNAAITPSGDWKYPVLPGEELGDIIQSAPSKNGVTVTGKNIKPNYEGSGKAIEFPEDCNCRIDQRSFSIRSEVYGFVSLQGQAISVVDKLTISRDAMRVTGTVHHRDCAGLVLTRENMQKALHTLGITASIDAKNYEKAWQRAVDTDLPMHNILLCKGTPPLHGQDGYFEFTAKDERDVVGVKDSSGRMDFRARGVIRAVEKDTELGKIKPPVPGMAGRDVRGRSLPAREGLPCKVVPKENVLVKPDGLTYVAAEKGVVVYARNTIAVTDVYQIQGDVDMGVGNINLEKGSLHVKGAILSGFTIDVPGNVLVEQVIENSRIKAGGSVEVRGGILMESGGFIKAAGDVMAVFGMNATIEAGGDVLIKHELTNCSVIAEGMLKAIEGRGKIVGSFIHAYKGVRAQEVGSDLGVETVIKLGEVTQANQERATRKRELVAIIEKINACLGGESDASIIKRTPPDKMSTITRLLETRNKAALELVEIERAIEEERETQRNTLLRTRLKVNKTLWPGVVVHAGGAQHRITSAVQHCQVFFDPDRKELVLNSL